MNDNPRWLRENNVDRSVVSEPIGFSQFRQELFDHILLGLLLISLAIGLMSFAIQGISSPWFVRAVGLLLLTIVAYGVRRVGQFMAAGYILLLWLVGIVASMFLQAGAITNFTPYLFIPIIVTSGLILGARATYLIAAFSIALTLGMIAASEKLTATNLSSLLPPFGVTILTTLLIAQVGRYVDQLGGYLLESDDVLPGHRERLQKALEETENLRQRAANLERELSDAQAEASRARRIALQRQKNLNDLISGTLQELDHSKKDLEDIIQQLEDLVIQNDEIALFERAWHRLDYLSGLVINLEELARLENEEVGLNYRAVDVARMIEEAVTTARGLAREKNIEIRHRLPDNLPVVKADPVRLWQVLLHLLSNAVKFTDDGIIEVQAELTGQQELMIFVSDTGIGMYREEMELIFEKFGRGRGTLAKQRRGPGLGLAICKRLIELHGGRMWVSGVLGVGSTFYLTLPLSRAASAVQEPLSRAKVSIGTISTAPSSRSVPVSSARVESEPTLVATRPDEEATILAQAPPRPTPVTKPKFGSPVSRFSPTYVERLGLTAIGLLLLIAGAVSILAIVNGVNRDAETNLEATSTSSGVAVETSVTRTALPTTGVTPMATIISTPTAQGLAAPTSLPTVAPVSTPTGIPTEMAVTSTVAATSSLIQELSPTLSPSPTNTGASAGVPEPEEVTAVPVLLGPTVTPSQQLSFFIDQGGGAKAVAHFGLDGQPGAGTAQVLDAVNDDRLSWSPSGQLLFTTDRDGNREIYVTAADGRQVVNLSGTEGDDMQPAWSPDGTQIAFSSGRNGNLDIYVMDAAGSNLRQLTTSRGFDEWPVWSAASQSIAFVSDRSGNVEVYTMNTDGSNQRRLTHDPAEDWPAAWSPDGSRLVFSSNRDSNWNLYVVDAAGNNVVRLTNDPANERDPIWSADGLSIAFSYDGQGNWDVYTIPVPTGLPAEIPRSAWTQVTNTPTDERYPTWIP